MKVINLLLCGGLGSRLWPLSNINKPKQFCNLINNTSLFKNTLERINNEYILIVTNKKYEYEILRDKLVTDLINFDIIFEPCIKNTGPAILLASLFCKQKFNNEHIIISVFPSDHIIDIDIYSQKLPIIYQKSLEGKIITLGIKPTSPDTGFGYISHNNGDIINFYEKPTLEYAKKYIMEGYLWNCGIFFFEIKTILDEFKIHDPEMLSNGVIILEKSLLVDNKLYIDKDYNIFSDIPFDKCIMEKTMKGFCIQYNGIWNDIGDWKRIYDISNKDENNNVITGNNIKILDTNNCLINSKHNMRVIGCDNMAIIDTVEGILISDIDKSCLIKNIKNDNTSKNFRPWGYYRTIELNEKNNFQIKKIVVYPKSRLSLQSHNFRSEFWVIVEGSGIVQIGENNIIVDKNSNIFIPIGVKHRITNTGINNLVFIETQIGTYLGEDDITRYEDDYGRL